MFQANVVEFLVTQGHTCHASGLTYTETFIGKFASFQTVYSNRPLRHSIRTKHLRKDKPIWVKFDRRGFLVELHQLPCRTDNFNHH
jgi:hypothetical protein